MCTRASRAEGRKIKWTVGQIVHPLFFRVCKYGIPVPFSVCVCVPDDVLAGSLVVGHNVHLEEGVHQVLGMQLTQHPAGKKVIL